MLNTWTKRGVRLTGRVHVQVKNPGSIRRQFEGSKFHDEAVQKNIELSMRLHTSTKPYRERRGTAEKREKE